MFPLLSGFEYPFLLALFWQRQDLRSKGWRSGESAFFSPMCPGSNPGGDATCGLSLVLVLSFAPRGFSPGTPAFPSPQKPTFPNSNSTRNQVEEEPLCGCATSKSVFIYLIVYLFGLVVPGFHYLKALNYLHYLHLMYTYLGHISCDIPVSCSFVPLSLVEGVAFIVLSDVFSAPRFLVFVFFFVVRAEFQAAVLAQEEFR